MLENVNWQRQVYAETALAQQIPSQFSPAAIGNDYEKLEDLVFAGELACGAMRELLKELDNLGVSEEYRRAV